MQRYRIAFFVTLAAAILLAAGVILLWLDPQVLKARFSSVVSRAPSSPEAARSGSGLPHPPTDAEHRCQNRHRRVSASS
jgi:hypothetical protein